MPEVFLKALCIARNIGKKVENFVTVHDMISIITTNKYPEKTDATRICYYCHHEIMLPLLRIGILCKLSIEMSKPELLQIYQNVGHVKLAPMSRETLLKSLFAPY